MSLGSQTLRGSESDVPDLPDLPGIFVRREDREDRLELLRAYREWQKSQVIAAYSKNLPDRSIVNQEFHSSRDLRLEISHNQYGTIRNDSSLNSMVANNLRSSDSD